MKRILEDVWAIIFGPILQRPKRLQVAALCHKGSGDDRKYLLVTSRETRRWIIPKGWPIKGLNSIESALQEAWEEAGVKGKPIGQKPIGSFTYRKTRPTGWSFPVKTLVFSVAVERLSKKFPEVEERTRNWVTAKEAADLVAESELSEIFLSHSDQIGRNTVS